MEDKTIIKNKTIPIKITTISPVHIGSGKSIDTSVETIKKNGKVAFLSLNKILEKIAANRRQLYELSSKIEGRSNKSLEEIFSGNKNVLEEATIYELIDERTAFSKDIETFLKDARNIPLFPGTTLKGAIRTIIFAAYLKKNKEVFYNSLKINQIEKIENFVFGENMQESPLKIIKTEDISFSIEHLSIRTVKVFDISNNGERCGFKKMGRNSDITTINSATPINVEAIIPGTIFESNIKIDEYFIKNIDKFTKKNKNDKKWKWFKEFFSDFFNMLATSSRYNSLEYVNNELEFYQKYKFKCNIDKVIDFYKQLKDEIEKSSGTVYTQIAWGSGWKGMTGNAYDEEKIEKIIKKMGREHSKTFPKTRKLFVEENEFSEYATMPAGWIKIERR